MANINSVAEIVFELIKTAVWGTEFHPPMEVDWPAVYREMSVQTVLALPMDRLDELHISEEIKEKWKNRILRENAKYYQVACLQNELHGLFVSRGIEYVILKGMAAACYYPKPEYRMFGDIDLLVGKDQYEEALKLLAENGYSREGETYKHANLKKYGVDIELHRRVSNDETAEEYPSQINSVDAYIMEGFSDIRQVCADECTFNLLPRKQNGMVLLQHMKNHLRTRGLGLRQIVDWMMYVDRELDDETWTNEFQPAAQQLGLETLAVIFTRLCQIYLGLSEKIQWCKAAPESLCEELMNEFVVGGNFGKKRGNAGRVTRVMLLLKKKGYFRGLQQNGISNWKACQRYQWLKPFAWLYQIIRLVRKSSDMDLGKIAESIQASGKWERILERLDIN